jgi:hypothetical protein
MATPPPEGAAVLKEEKPLAAPALNDVTPALSLNRYVVNPSPAVTMRADKAPKVARLAIEWKSQH